MPSLSLQFENSISLPRCSSVTTIVVRTKTTFSALPHETVIGHKSTEIIEKMIAKEQGASVGGCVVFAGFKEQISQTCAVFGSVLPVCLQGGDPAGSHPAAGSGSDLALWGAGPSVCGGRLHLHRSQCLPGKRRPGLVVLQTFQHH